MKQVRWIFGAVFVLVCLVMAGVPAASAETIVVEGGNITVQTKVQHTHYILINDHGKIIQIDSNTTELAKPRIFLHKVAMGNERPMTEDVYEQYQGLIPTGKTRVGTVYKQTDLPALPLFNPVIEVRQTDFLALLR